MRELYLSRLTVSLRTRDARRDLGNVHDLHRRVMLGFPDEEGHPISARERYGVLFRAEPQPGGRFIILVQSLARPDWSRLPAGYLAGAALVKRIDGMYDSLRVGLDLRFRLQANPSKRLRAGGTADPERWAGKRIGLRGEEDQLAWLARKSTGSGFALLAVRTSPNVADVRTQVAAMTRGMRKETGKLSFEAVVFEGRLRITDLARFHAALVEGIGPAKGYGFGLLSIAPPTADGD